MRGDRGSTKEDSPRLSLQTKRSSMSLSWKDVNPRQAVEAYKMKEMVVIRATSWSFKGRSLWDRSIRREWMEAAQLERSTSRNNL